MKKLWQLLVSFITLVILLLIGYGILVAFTRFITSVKSELSTAILAVLGTILVAVLSIPITKYFENKTSVRASLREKKIPVYESLITFYFRMLDLDKSGIKLEGAEFFKMNADVIKGLTIWASDEVLKSASKMRKIMITGTPDPKIAMLAFEDMLKEIRKDLGHNNSKIIPGDILNLFINDVETFLK